MPRHGREDDETFSSASDAQGQELPWCSDEWDGACGGQLGEEEWDGRPAHGRTRYCTPESKTEKTTPSSCSPSQKSSCMIRQTSPFRLIRNTHGDGNRKPPCTAA
nr:hypothetical protein CFP56_67003 [Quercus suber]